MIENSNLGKDNNIPRSEGENIESKEKLEIVEIPKIVRGSFSDKPGEAGFISFTTNPNFLSNKELHEKVSKLNLDLEIIASRKVAIILRPVGNQIFLGITSPSYTRFQSVNRTYDQACITFADIDNPSTGNIFSNSKMFGNYTKLERENDDKKIRNAENISNEIELREPVKIPEKLISTLQEYLQKEQKLLIENNEEITLEGNQILDYAPVRTLLCLYDKLNPELKKEYSVYFGLPESLYTKSASKVIFSLKPLTEQQKEFTQILGYSVLKWDDLIK